MFHGTSYHCSHAFVSRQRNASVTPDTHTHTHTHMHTHVTCRFVQQLTSVYFCLTLSGKAHKSYINQISHSEPHFLNHIEILYFCMLKQLLQIQKCSSFVIKRSCSIVLVKGAPVCKDNLGVYTGQMLSCQMTTNYKMSVNTMILVSLLSDTET